MVVCGRQTRLYDLCGRTTLHDLKGMISRAEGIGVESMDLCYKGKILADDRMFVGNCFEKHVTYNEALLIGR